MQDTTRVSVIEAGALTASDFERDFFRPRRPVILRGGAASWPLMHTWTRSHLQATREGEGCVVTRDSRPARSKLRMSLSAYFASSEPGLATFTYRPLEPEATGPTILDDLPGSIRFWRRDDLAGYAFFHGDIGTGTLPHVHRDAFNILQSGRKRWAMFDAAPDCAPEGWDALIDILRVHGAGAQARTWFETSLAPLRYAGVQVYEGEQTAGDVVFIPEYFAHAVVNLSVTQGMVVQRKRTPTPSPRPRAYQVAFPGADVPPR